MILTKKPKRIIAIFATAFAIGPLACSKDKEPETPEQPLTPASETYPGTAPQTDQPYPSQTPGTGTPSMDDTGTGGSGTWGTDDMPDDTDMPDDSDVPEGSSGSDPSGGDMAPQGSLMQGGSSLEGTGGTGGTGGNGGTAGNGGDGGMHSASARSPSKPAAR